MGLDFEYFNYNDCSSGSAAVASEKGQELNCAVIDWCASHDAQKIESTMEAARVLCAAVNTAKSAYENERSHSRGDWVKYTDQTSSAALISYYRACFSLYFIRNDRPVEYGLPRAPLITRVRISSCAVTTRPDSRVMPKSRSASHIGTDGPTSIVAALLHNARSLGSVLFANVLPEINTASHVGRSASSALSG